jgi:hypothetical protein
VPDKLQEAAERQLHVIDDMLQSALKWPKRVITGLVLAFALSLGGIGGVSYLYVNETAIVQQQQSVIAQNKALAETIQHAAIQSCQAANARRQTDQQNWNFFLDLALQGNTNPSALAKANELRVHVAKADAPSNCAVFK